MSNLNEQLAIIATEITLAHQHLGHLAKWMAELDAAGMYPAMPTREAWESRGNGQEYMYHYFAANRRSDGYQGPDGKRKVYVGNDPDRVNEARQLAHRRQRWEKFNNIYCELRLWLANREDEIERLAQRCRMWPGKEISHERAK